MSTSPLHMLNSFPVLTPDMDVTAQPWTGGMA
jgi:hypothetical protein